MLDSHLNAHALAKSSFTFLLHSVLNNDFINSPRIKTQSDGSANLDDRDHWIYVNTVSWLYYF